MITYIDVSSKNTFIYRYNYFYRIYQYIKKLNCSKLSATKITGGLKEYDDFIVMKVNDDDIILI